MISFRFAAFPLAAVLLVALSLRPDVVRAAEETAFDAHANTFSYFFEDGDMDFHFGNLILGSAGNGGVETGEAYYVASQIQDGDAASWQQQWFELARRVQARGEQSLAGGHTVSACTQFLRAAYYYRLSVISMLPDDPQLKERAAAARELMRKAGALMDPPLEYIEIPFEDTVLPGFFRKAANGYAPTKTLIMIGGGETFAEDLYFYIAPQAFARGYNFMTVDLPGQGVLPSEGLVFRPDMYVPMQAVVDYAVGMPEVDTERLAMFGYSGGGGFAPQAAEHDPRIKAVVMSAAVVDAYPLFSDMPAVVATPEEMAAWSSFHANVVQVICWRWGVPMDTPSALAEANKGFTFDPTGIDVPALIVVGEGEMKSDEVRRQQKLALGGFSNPDSKMVVTPSNEGASNHCIMENRSIVGQVVFDWLDDIFE
ncbi:alpha/beta hydrolase family protein [Oceanidesulfovibrio marinus]|uniref:Alpha/beta hydrolase n=1 Tax=Oceanidesulfovibrio marinus TaxID=370038 RepID=A0ABX6NFR5_9BACT|nr:alpha/beta hydrolase [Oceanidesulfovibrio marinus]QJT09468.1 alpha/beta hydrolase [Oceanidesulfovibrio marinus]